VGRSSGLCMPAPKQGRRSSSMHGGPGVGTELIRQQAPTRKAIKWHMSGAQGGRPGAHQTRSILRHMQDNGPGDRAEGVEHYALTRRKANGDGWCGRPGAQPGGPGRTLPDSAGPGNWGRISELIRSIPQQGEP
jgi:hypothetical protein